MMERINRNDPCPCGSRKMYKKCCGANEAISINQIIESEIDELQKRFIHFAFFHFDKELENDFSNFEEFYDIEDEEERQFFEFIHVIWFSLFTRLEDGERIIDKFIYAEADKIKRPKLRTILQSWTDARTIAGKVLKIDDSMLKVEDGFTGEQLDAVITGVPVTMEEGSFFIGILVPYEQNYVFFPQPYDLPDLDPEVACSYIADSSLESGSDTPQEYLTECFLDILSQLPMLGGLIDLDELEWPAPVYKEVADLYKEKMISLDAPPPLIDTGVALWFSFCQKKQKRIQKPLLYAAALNYFLLLVMPTEETIKVKEIATLYGVSSRSISPIVSEMESELAAEIAELIGIFYEEDEDDTFLQKGTVVQFPNKRDGEKQ